MKLHRLTYIVWICFIGIYVLGNHLLPVTDPVESNYALTAKEMVLSGNWLSPQIYGHFWYDKPIMIYWLLALSYSVFGFTDFASRFPSALFGALSVAFLYQGVRTISGRKLLALGAACIMGTSLIFWVMAHGIVTDMVLLFATVGIFYYAYRGLMTRNPWHMAAAYVFSGIAVLTKGPVGLVLPGILFLVYAGIRRSWSTVKSLFPWQGIVAFILIVLPWYGYMYSAHGMDFINGFLGLHNVTRATQSEHPEVNHWWYYLPIFLGGSLPWTGAILYGMYQGWKKKPSFYIYSMILGWGTVLFYTVMATKYPTYAFISVMPFSFIGSWGLIKMMRSDASRRLWWWLLGPTFILWWALGIGSFYAPWGFWWILRALVVGFTLFLLGCYWYRKRIMIPITVGVGTLAILGIVLMEALVPFLAIRSSVTYHQHIASYQGTMYYYGDYATSIPYYLDKTPVRVYGDDEDASSKESRSDKWKGKDVMPQMPRSEFYRRVKAREDLLIIANMNDANTLKASEVGALLHRQDVTDKVAILRTK